MKAFLAILALIPPWIVAGYIVYSTIHNPHTSELSVLIPCLTGLYSLMVLWMIDAME